MGENHPEIKMTDSFSNVGSFRESAGGESVGGFGETGRKRMRSEKDQSVIKRSDWTTIIPDLCYCGSCNRVYFYKINIFSHTCKGYAKGRKKELTKDCNLEDFLNCLLPLILVERDPLSFCRLDFFNICYEEKLFGAPLDCYFGGFMLWVLIETWGKTDDYQKGFLNRLFDSPRQKIDWNQYPQLKPLSNYEENFPPTICIYRGPDVRWPLLVKKKVEDGDGDGDGDEDEEEDGFGDGYDRSISEILREHNLNPEMMMDPDDLKTYFKGRKLGFCHTNSKYYHVYGNSLESVRVFELYSIVINGSKPDFSLIYMRSDATSLVPLIIYKPPEGKEVALQKSLPLKGLSRFLLPTPDYEVFISTNSNPPDDTWRFARDSASMSNCYDDVISETCCNNNNTSSATITYQVMYSAVRAELNFTFFEVEGRKITITDGEITVTDGGDSRTKRIVQEYDTETPVHVRTGQRLQVTRCVFAVPDDSYLRVNVNLVYFVARFPENTKTIGGRLDFKMPKYASTHGHTLHSSDGSLLCVETFWTGGR